MKLRTDDDIYRARLLYLGPPGYTFPVHLPYAQYGVFTALLAFYMFVHWLFTFRVEIFPAWEIALAMVSTSLIFRYVDPDRPARAVIRTVLTDWRRTREPMTEQRDRRFSANRIVIREELA
ncbi:hypothetical protein LX16_2438 [Stackebrandtia albiflava]|uniref:TcpE family protein n=1 Tax=Stackebrandtia albiflava TaxID=406432 RepID=A0A562V1I1_9ACTN|nr:hypothetical protein [Stackebrandtia albiflava]TWJ11711.1 hypothetical protein LX16_2438 [Stackebrandtia albiflava]